MPTVGLFRTPNQITYPDQADLMRERVLLVGFGTAFPSRGDPTVNPNTLVPPFGAPFFFMSPFCTSELPTVGFAITLLQEANFLPPNGGGALVLTAWRYIQQLGQNKTISPVYTAFQPVTGVNYNEEYVTFDCDAGAFRFQVTGIVNANSRMAMVFTEL